MFTTIRKHQRWLMTLIAALTIIAFAWLYNTTDLDRVGTNIIAKIYGRDVMQVDIERAVRNYQLAIALGQFDLVRELTGQARTEEEAANNFIWNLMVLQHEAEVMGVEPGTEAVVNRIKTLPVFQTDGQFDPMKYSQFLQEQLAPRGFTERQLESVIKDSLRLDGLKALVESPAILLPGEMQEAIGRTRPFDLEVIRWEAPEVAKDVKVTDEEMQQAFTERAASLTVPEKRSVRYVAFSLAPDQRDLAGRERIEALQKAATATGDLTQGLADGGESLTQAAARLGAQVRTTPLFGPDGSTEGALADEDGEVVPAAAGVAFRLPPGDGNYEIVTLGDSGYAVIEVADVQPSRPMTFEEARADLRADLIAAKKEGMVREAAEAVLGRIREALGEGGNFDQAAEGVKTESLTGVSVFNPDLDAAHRQIAATALDMQVGQLGTFVPSPEGGFAIYVRGRGEPGEEVLAEQRPMIEESILQGKAMLLFAQWLTMAREASGLQILRPMM